eukprot:GSMAST32.ASY1.ANO1.1208.1 assembled CDS
MGGCFNKQQPISGPSSPSTRGNKQSTYSSSSAELLRDTIEYNNRQDPRIAPSVRYAGTADFDKEVSVRENVVWKRTADPGSRLKRGDCINNYRVHSSKPLGKGFQSIVYLVEDDGSGPRAGYLSLGLDNEKYAMKVLKVKRMAHAKKGLVAKGENFKANAGQDDVWAEIQVGKMTRHKNLTRLVEVIRGNESSEIILLMELEPNGIVVDKKKGEYLPVGLAQSYFRDSIDGIAYLHKLGIVHRDLKVENLLVGKENIVKLADFGMAHIINDVKSDPLGSGLKRVFLAHEMAPEGEYDGVPADIWSIGCCLHCMITGKLPFSHKDKKELSRIVQNQPYPVKDFPKISSRPMLRDLMLKLLEKDPQKRITIDEILKHPWMSCKAEFDREQS